jgi:TRAP-type uncharacterized transport system fused permease subunit
MTPVSILLIGLHTLVAWTLIEIFVNTCHHLSRARYVFFHYVVVLGAFAAVFSVYFRFFTIFNLFWTTIVAMAFMLFFELTVFRYLYSGERWFLNWVDWIVPIFLSVTSVYWVGVLMI